VKYPRRLWRREFLIRTDGQTQHARGVLTQMKTKAVEILNQIVAFIFLESLSIKTTRGMQHGMSRVEMLSHGIIFYRP
jgi:hypothetical protein